MLARPVLVAYASRHHGTEEMAIEIAAALRVAGFEVDLRAASDVLTIEPYGAVIVGSAVYMFHWEIPALELIRRERVALATRKVWLFSSGPVGDGKSTRHPETVPHPDGVDELADEVGARGRAMFGGRVDPRQDHPDGPPDVHAGHADDEGGGPEDDEERADRERAARATRFVH